MRVRQNWRFQYFVDRSSPAWISAALDVTRNYIVSYPARRHASPSIRAFNLWYARAKLRDLQACLSRGERGSVFHRVDRLFIGSPGFFFFFFYAEAATRSVAHTQWRTHYLKYPLINFQAAWILARLVHISLARPLVVSKLLRRSVILSCVQ